MKLEIIYCKNELFILIDLFFPIVFFVYTDIQHSYKTKETIHTTPDTDTSHTSFPPQSGALISF